MGDFLVVFMVMKFVQASLSENGGPDWPEKTSHGFRSCRAHLETRFLWDRPLLTDGPLVHYEAADHPLIAAALGEAVPSEDDVERVCGM